LFKYDAIFRCFVLFQAILIQSIMNINQDDGEQIPGFKFLASVLLYIKDKVCEIYIFLVGGGYDPRRKRPHVRCLIGGLNMKNRNNNTVAGQDYTKAHDMHYKTKDLPKAFNLYRDIIVEYPNTEEAGYSLSQVKNIMNEVVPKQEVMDTLVALTLAHFDKNVPPVKSASEASLAL